MSYESEKDEFRQQQVKAARRLLGKIAEFVEDDVPSLIACAYLDDEGKLGIVMVPPGLLPADEMVTLMSYLQGALKESVDKVINITATGTLGQDVEPNLRQVAQRARLAGGEYLRTRIKDL